MTEAKRTIKPRKPRSEPIANPTTGETSKGMWHRWSLERLERERQEKLKADAAAQAYTERAIFTIEIARAVAQLHGQTVCPEWRYLKDLIAEEYGRILREQPEMRQRDVKAREQIITALFNGLPAHLQGALSELRTVMDLVGMARESTAFLLGFELGREAGRQNILRDPRVMLAPEPTRRALPDVKVVSPLRLHAADEDA